MGLIDLVPKFYFWERVKGNKMAIENALSFLKHEPDVEIHSPVKINSEGELEVYFPRTFFKQNGFKPQSGWEIFSDQYGTGLKKYGCPEKLLNQLAREGTPLAHLTGINSQLISAKAEILTALPAISPSPSSIDLFQKRLEEIVSKDYNPLINVSIKTSLSAYGAPWEGYDLSINFSQGRLSLEGVGPVFKLLKGIDVPRFEEVCPGGKIIFVQDGEVLHANVGKELDLRRQEQYPFPLYAFSCKPDKESVGYAEELVTAFKQTESNESKECEKSRATIESAVQET